MGEEDTFLLVGVLIVCTKSDMSESREPIELRVGGPLRESRLRSLLLLGVDCRVVFGANADVDASAKFVKLS